MQSVSLSESKTSISIIVVSRNLADDFESRFDEDVTFDFEEIRSYNLLSVTKHYANTKYIK